MPATLRGIYHNLKESKYAVSNSEIAFFFSSEFYLKKFLQGYEEYRENFSDKLSKMSDTNILNMDTLADIAFYKQVEKRGFCVWLKNIKISEVELHQYALRKMTDMKSPLWQKIERPKIGERIK
jgi:uncharacterized protein (DUF608 family)